MWPERTAEVLEVKADMDARAAAKGRTLRYGWRSHVIVRETEAEARAAARRLLSKLDDERAHAIRHGRSTASSAGVARQAALRESADDEGYVERTCGPASAGPARAAGAAIVGDPDQVLAKIRELADAGIEAFILSGLPARRRVRPVRPLRAAAHRPRPARVRPRSSEPRLTCSFRDPGPAGRPGARARAARPCPRGDVCFRRPRRMCVRAVVRLVVPVAPRRGGGAGGTGRQHKYVSLRPRFLASTASNSPADAPGRHRAPRLAAVARRSRQPGVPLVSPSSCVVVGPRRSAEHAGRPGAGIPMISACSWRRVTRSVAPRRSRRWMASCRARRRRRRTRSRWSRCAERCRSSRSHSSPARWASRAKRSGRGWAAASTTSARSLPRRRTAAQVRSRSRWSSS